MRICVKENGEICGAHGFFSGGLGHVGKFKYGGISKLNANRLVTWLGRSASFAWLGFHRIDGI